ncbi:protein of unknown function [Priestia aryabhattai B8W22]|uniref:DUF3846 domain-containing protein n=1 Tax=Priestia aryabhattai TaxID=412384 RepID=UPI00089003AB|nr:protein of unknown function [Priestia aryabhattai B8W22]
MLKVIIVEPNEMPYVREIGDGLYCMRKIVGGYIECVNLGIGLTLVCNEEGKLNGLPPNRIVGGDVIAGTFFLTKREANTGDFVDLSELEIEMLMNDFCEFVIGR